MEYAAMTFWLFVIVFSALGVHKLWSTLIRPKIFNSILLPGTLVAQLGYILGLLVTGGTVDNTSLIKDDESGEPQTGQDPKPRIPVIGTIVVALLPMAGCAIAIGGVSRYLGSEILAGMAEKSLAPPLLPTSLSAFFGVLYKSISLVEHLVMVVRGSNLADWRTLLFLYLVICLTVRMAPLTGNLKGSLGSILLFGIFTFLLGTLIPASAETIAAAWPLITFCSAVLFALLMVSMLVTGLVHLAKTLFGEG